MSLGAISTHLLKCLEDSNSTPFLGSTFQCITTFSVKTIFLMSNLNLLRCNLMPVNSHMKKRNRHLPLYNLTSDCYRVMRSPLKLLLSRLSSPSSPDSPYKSLFPVLSPHLLLSFEHSPDVEFPSCWGAQNRLQYSRCGLNLSQVLRNDHLHSPIA